MPPQRELQLYADSLLTVYEAYQQSWRWLGVFVDCKASENDDDNEGSEYCQRYLLWAAYVDPNYQNHGVNEYQYFHDNAWNKDACTSGSPCRKLDCHSSNTQFQILGIFKEPLYASEWFEQLFKHSGFCVWNSSTYSFMQSNYAAWPEQCTATGVAVPDSEDGSEQYLYIDLKPGPSLELELYTDSICKTVYSGTAVTTFEAASDLGFVPSHETQGMFQAALETFKSCQPCRTMNLQVPSQFSCYDDAGYTNVNQCMKFSTHTTMEAATWGDIQTAAIQGALNDITVGQRTYYEENASSTWPGRGAFTVATVTFLSVWRYSRRRRQKRSNRKLSVPLVQKSARMQ